MTPEFIEDEVAKQPWVKPTEKALDAVAGATIARFGKAVKNFLHGTWLGHPLHPAVVTVPMGALTVTSMLDAMEVATGTEKYAPGADAALALGLGASTLAAASGLADWSKSNGVARRVGVLHAVCNGGATTLYLASWALRRRGQRSSAAGFGFLGWLLLMAGGWLGGSMSYHHKLGVDSAERNGPPDFQPVFPESELPENEPHRVDLDGVGVLVVKQHGKIFAIGEKCAHLGGPLSEGKLEDGAIRCPWHDSKFRLSDGQVLEGPSAYSQPCFEARVNNGQVEIRFVKKN
jgi:nitrite reductase/ring-hydroxylating ferredoxin subunit